MYCICGIDSVKLDMNHENTSNSQKAVLNHENIYNFKLLMFPNQLQDYGAQIALKHLLSKHRYVVRGHRFRHKIGLQPGRVANLARIQLNRENTRCRKGQLVRQWQVTAGQLSAGPLNDVCWYRKPQN